MGQVKRSLERRSPVKRNPVNVWLRNVEKIAKFFANVKSIWAGILIFFTGAVFAGNLQWVQKTDYKEDQKVFIIQQINREIADLEIKLLYTQERQRKAMMQAIIINKQTQIKNIRE